MTASNHIEGAQVVRTRVARTLVSLNSEGGNVESALTLIPLMVLFLSVLQIGVGVYGRMTTAEMTQGNVARQAMGIAASTSAGIGSGPLSVGNVTSLPLPGGGSLDIATATNQLPAFSPLLPMADQIGSVGIAVQE